MIDKCDNCTSRYICEGQHACNCINNNYKYYNPESKTADNRSTKINDEMGKLIVESENTITLPFKNPENILELNWGDGSCVLIMDNFNILDFRKIPFDKLDCVKLNGFRFVKEEENK